MSLKRLLSQRLLALARLLAVWVLLLLAVAAVSGRAQAGGLQPAVEGRGSAGLRLNSAAAARDAAEPELGRLAYEEARAYFVAADGTVLKVAAVTQRLQHGVYYIPWELAFGDRAPSGTRRVYLVHNHPGGNPQLSEADVRMGSFWAARAAEEGIALDLLALTRTGDYTSLRESGQLREVPSGLSAAVDYAGYVLTPGVQMAGARLAEVARSLIR